MSRLKAVEICKNLIQTISKMGDDPIYESQSSAYESSRAKKNSLIRIKKNLIKKYKITEKEILEHKLKIKN